MDSKPTIYLRQIDRLGTAIVTLPEDDYGSANQAKLDSLLVALDEMAAQTAEKNVILDLSEVAISGSAFLTCLDSFERQLKSAGRRLVVCRDRIGLIKIVNWAKRMNYQCDLAAALEWCALQSA